MNRESQRTQSLRKRESHTDPYQVAALVLLEPEPEDEAREEGRDDGKSRQKEKHPRIRLERLIRLNRAEIGRRHHRIQHEPHPEREDLRRLLRKVENHRGELQHHHRVPDPERERMDHHDPRGEDQTPHDKPEQVHGDTPQSRRDHKEIDNRPVEDLHEPERIRPRHEQLKQHRLRLRQEDIQVSRDDGERGLPQIPSQQRLRPCVDHMVERHQRHKLLIRRPRNPPRHREEELPVEQIHPHLDRRKEQLEHEVGPILQRTTPVDAHVAGEEGEVGFEMAHARSVRYLSTAIYLSSRSAFFGPLIGWPLV